VGSTKGDGGYDFLGNNYERTERGKGYTLCVVRLRLRVGFSYPSYSNPTLPYHQSSGVRLTQNPPPPDTIRSTIRRTGRTLCGRVGAMVSPSLGPGGRAASIATAVCVCRGCAWWVGHGSVCGCGCAIVARVLIDATGWRC
jgi:hypothetical protein